VGTLLKITTASSHRAVDSARSGTPAAEVSLIHTTSRTRPSIFHMRSRHRRIAPRSLRPCQLLGPGRAAVRIYYLLLDVNNPFGHTLLLHLRYSGWNTNV
jgi:hypothetical protein